MKCLTGAVIVSSMVLMAGCTSHYHEVQGGALVFSLKKPGVKQVIFACSLDGFEPHTAKNMDGKWVVSLPPNEPFRYFYVLDGEIFLPPCRMKEKDDFGFVNCVFDPILE